MTDGDAHDAITHVRRAVLVAAQDVYGPARCFVPVGGWHRALGAFIVIMA